MTNNYITASKVKILNVNNIMLCSPNSHTRYSVRIRVGCAACRSTVVHSTPVHH